MKNLKRIIVWSFVLLCTVIQAQEYNGNFNSNELRVANNMTTSLVFPFAIISADKGSEAIVVDKAKGVENILLVKAYDSDFVPTNLTIVTADGNLYSFIVNYSESSPNINQVITAELAVKQQVVFSPEIENKSKIEHNANLCLLKTKFLKGFKSKEFNLGIQVTGIYVQDNLFYFRLHLINDSMIDFEVDQLRFFIRDQKKSKRTASQELEIIPVGIFDSITIVPHESELERVVVTPKFTISNKKYLIIQLLEKNGTRQVGLKLNRRALTKILPL